MLRLNRAERFARRGRRAQAERWYRAAVESARRRGDEPGQADACQRLVDLLCRRDDWDAAGRSARSVLNTLGDTTARAEVAARLADILIAQAELGEAEALLSSISSELTIAGLADPESVHDVRAQLRFWQGRLDEAAAIPRTRPSVTRLMVDGAIAFLRRDLGGLTRCAARRRVAPIAAGRVLRTAVLRARRSRGTRGRTRPVALSRTGTAGTSARVPEAGSARPGSCGRGLVGGGSFASVRRGARFSRRVVVSARARPALPGMATRRPRARSRRRTPGGDSTQSCRRTGC